MKLISVKILGSDFRSLKANKTYPFNVRLDQTRLSTKIFAGVNGSGKSNFLELLSEIFYYLELYHFDGVSEAEKKAPDIGFEIEYVLPAIITYDEYTGQHYFVDKKISGGLIPEHVNQHVKIIKPLNKEPEFQSKIFEFAHSTFKRIDTGTENLLPTKIIAYTSGQNELLSNPFYKMRYRYFNEITKRAKDSGKGRKRTDLADNDRLYFLDYSSNFSIFVANMLLADSEKLKYLKTIFKVQDLHSFRITINYVNYQKKKIELGKKLNDDIEKLKSCATTWIRKTIGKEEILILDYLVEPATKEAFAYHFNDSVFALFRVFYELEISNLHLVPSDTRSLILKAHKSLNLSDEMPRVDPSRLVFRIEKIRVNKIVDEAGTVRSIYYKGLSDGEHQFNEVVGSVLMMEEDGCLFLMDEPDTHFNPQWRAKFIKTLNKVSATSIDSTDKVERVRNQEIIITTHSPFVISDSQRDDVYKFDKINGEVTYVNPQIETYGASIGLLLQEIFDRDVSISDLSNFDLEELRKAFLNLQDPKLIRAKIEETKARLVDFGESIEKFDLYSFLREMENELKSGQ